MQIGGGINFSARKLRGGKIQCKPFEGQQLRSATIFTKLNYCRLLTKQDSRSKHTKFLTWIILLLILLSGDVSPNPGPTKCGTCQKTIPGSQYSIRCGSCKITHHRTCADLSVKEYKQLILTASLWHCSYCLNSTAYPCGICGYNVREDQLSILCSFCNQWIHQPCTGLSGPELMRYDGANILWRARPALP